MTKIGTITLEGCSGRSYEFNIYPIETNFKSIGGVYYISRRQDNTHRHIYLGITEDLSTRFNNHHKEDCFIKNKANCISIYQNNSEEERQDIERDILCNYTFLCNEINN